MATVKPISTFTDYSAEQASIERRRKLAEMLQQQSMTPIEQQTAGGYTVPIHWAQGLAKMLQAYYGSEGQRKADEEGKALSTRRNQAMAEAIGGMPQARTETTPGYDMPDGDVMLPQQKTVEPSWADQAKWLGQLAQIGPDATQLGTTALGMQQKQRENELTRQSRLEERLMQIEANAQNQALTLQQRAQFQAEANALRRELADQRNDLARELAAGRNENALAIKELGRGMAANQPITPVTLQDPKNPNATIVVDGRSGRVIGAGPKMTESGKLETKRQFNMQGIGQTIQEAENLLSGAGGRPLPTGSGVGTAVDYIGSVFGASPSGAKEADSLRAVGASLISKMPRMEGPQSDKDVALYREAAGRVGDSTLPIDRRKAALQTVKDLWAKYERLNPGAFEGAGPQGGGATGTFDGPPPGAVRRKN